MLELIRDPKQWTWRPNSPLRRIVLCFVGVMIVSLGTAICLHDKTGVDPFTALQQSVTEVTGLSLAVLSPIINLVMLILIIPFDRKIFGLGTLMNALLFGVFVTVFLDVLEGFYTFEYSLGGMLVHLVIGLTLYCLGLSIYISTDIGQGAADGLAPVLTRKFKNVSYRTFRIGQDVISALIALIILRFDLSLSSVGVGTLIMSLFIGVIVDFFNRTVSNWLISYLRL